MKRVATCIIEVRDGHVTNYRGDYDAYVYSVNKEIEDGEREQATRMSKAPADVVKPNKAPAAPRRNEREVRKEISTLERTIAKFDDQKKKSNAQLMQATDPKEALRLHNEVAELTAQLAEAEEKWCSLQDELGSD